MSRFRATKLVSCPSLMRRPHSQIQPGTRCSSVEDYLWSSLSAAYTQYTVSDWTKEDFFYLQLQCGTGRTLRSQSSHRHCPSERKHGRSCCRRRPSYWECSWSRRSSEASCGPSSPRWSWKTRRSHFEKLCCSCVAHHSGILELFQRTLWTSRFRYHCQFSGVSVLPQAFITAAD